MMREDSCRRFALHVERFLEQMQVIGWSPRTLEAYRSHLGFFIAHLDAETDVEEITEVLPETLHAYQAHLFTWTGEDGRGLSIATQAARLSAVRSFFRHLVKSDVLLHDPAAGVMPPKRKGTLPRSILTKQEVARLLASPDARTPLGLRDRAMLEVLYSTGIRNAELRALRIYDLDLDRGLLRVNEGKNAKDRVVPLGRAASNYLREYIAEARPKLLVGRGSGGATDETVFLSRTGRPLRTLGVIYPIQKHAKRAGIERKITPHTFRHTFATHMLQGRADIRHIQAMLGHSLVATTQIYTRVDVTDLKAVHRRCHPRERR